MNKYRRFDRVAVAGALLAFVSTLNYMWSSSQLGGQGSWWYKRIPSGVAYFTNERPRPVLWASAALIVAIAMASYGARFDSPYRRIALSLAGVDLLVMGKLAWWSGMAVFSIGIPLVVAGLICLVAVARRRRLAPGA
jgi:hypothetical protein